MCLPSLGIVSNPKLLNVALTRAKYGLLCIGNADILCGGSKDFQDLISNLRNRKCLVEREAFVKSLRGNQCGNRWAKASLSRSRPAVPTVRPEDSCSNVGVGSHSHVGVGVRDALDDVIDGSQVSNAPSSISVLSDPRGGPKCFLRGTLLRGASSLMIPVECLEEGSRICSAVPSGACLEVPPSMPSFWKNFRPPKPSTSTSPTVIGVFDDK